MKALISDADARRIEAKIAEAETSSTVELVVAVVERSGRYSAFRALIAAGAALSAALAVLRWGGAIAPAWAVLAELPVAALAYAAFGAGPIVRALVPARVLQRAAQAHAERLFYQRGLHRTRARTGLLLLVSALERRVVVLGDAGLHAVVGDAGWQAHVAHLVSRVRQGHAADGILEIIERVEATAARELPPRSGQPNELPDAVIKD